MARVLYVPPPLTPARASVYSAEQLQAYAMRIHLPEEYWPASKPPATLETLQVLFRHMITALPYENLALHYSPEQGMPMPSLDPHELLQKQLHNGRGGYCVESGLVVREVLKGYGYKALTVGVRNRARIDGVPQGLYFPWTHCLNLVYIDGVKYAYDPAFGGDGPTRPLPLADPPVAATNVGTQQGRMALAHAPDLTDPDDDATRLWTYQYRNAPDAPWNSFYSFSDLVFASGACLDASSYWAARHPGSFQTWTTTIVRFLGDNDVVSEKGITYGTAPRLVAAITGKIMLAHNLVKLNTGGRTRVVAETRTDAERAAAIQTWFGISLSDAEVAGIKGRLASLDGPEGVPEV